jgi:hypothetical protein
MNGINVIQDISIIIFQKIFIVLPKAIDIIAVKISEYGPKPHIKIFRELQTQFKLNQTFKGDKAFIGGLNISIPHKKPKIKNLRKKKMKKARYSQAIEFL